MNIDKFQIESVSAAATELVAPIETRHTHNAKTGMYYAGYSITQPWAHVWRCVIEGCNVSMTKLCPFYFGHYNREACDVCTP